MVTPEPYRRDMRVQADATAYGRPAMVLLAEQVDAAKAGDPLAPVTVVVATNYAAVAARRALAARSGGVANVSFLTLYRLAERLAAPRLAAENRLPVSAPVLAAAVRAVLADDPGVFAPVADHPATEQALVAAHRELGVAPDASLDAVAACSPRAADVVRIHRSVRDRLQADWHNEHDLVVTAADVIRAGGVRDLGPVIVHLLHEVNAAAADLIGALAEAGDLGVNVGITGDVAADAPVLAMHARAGVGVPVHEVEPAGASHIVSASDPDEEVRAAVRLVTAWMHEGQNLGGVALLYGMPDPYARLLHEQLTAAGIVFNGAPVREVADLLFGRTLRGLLALPDRGYRRPDVLGVLTGAPLLDGDRRVPGRAWERISREAGVVGGDDWDERLATLTAQLRQRAVDLDAEGEGDRRADRNRRDADTADALALFIRRLRSDLELGGAATTWTELVEWTKRLIETYVGDERHRARWPEEERLAAERVEAALDRLAGLDALDGPAPTLEVFRRALDGELETTARRVGRFGEGVLVGHVSGASGLMLDRVVMLGMAEGAFPPRRLEDSLLPDAERAAAGGALALRAERVHEDRHHLLAAIASAEQAVLCQPRGDLRRSGERPASRWLLADAARLAGVPTVRSDDLGRHGDNAWLDHVASFAGGLARLALPATEQELRLAAVARQAHDHPVLTSDDALAAALEVVAARRSDRFTRFDGNLAAVAAEVGRPERASASRLQTWAKCPHQYLLQYVLGVDPVEEPERLLMISALDRGSLIHDILDDFVGGAITAGHPLDRWGPGDQAQLILVADEHFGRYEAQGRTGRDLFWRRDRAQILVDLDRFLDEDNKRLAEGCRPLRTELPFGGLAVTLPSGHVVHVGGKVDRIDRRADGSLVVLDYKTGSSKSYTNLSPQEPHGGGRLLQLYLYALAAEEAFPTGLPVWSGYWFNSTKGGFRLAGYEVTPEVAAEVAGAIDVIIESIAGGVFPAHPGEPSSRISWVDCWYCTPDGLSGADRRRDWERKRLDPALTDYVMLAEPEVVDGHA
jgi:RecB family exonuclease